MADPDSPRQSAFYPVNSPPLPGSANPPSPYHTVRNQQSNIPVSSSAPSLRGLLATRPFPAMPEGHDDKSMTAEGSAQNSSRQRLSFENSRASASTPGHSPRAKVNVHPLLREAIAQSSQGIDSRISRVTRASDPTRPSSAGRFAGVADSPKKSAAEPVSTSSVPHSRTNSPIRLFSWPRPYRNHEDPFVPVNPFQSRKRLRRLSLRNSDVEHNLPLDSTCEENPICIPFFRRAPKDRIVSLLWDLRYFILENLPRQIYLLLLLRLPSLYFARIARVYEDAQLSKPILEHMIESYCSPDQQQRQRIARSSPIPHHPLLPELPFPDEWTSANVPPALIRFKQSWENFIDSLLREWKTLNLVSALLHSAIISMLQIQVIQADPIIRTAALLSLTSALISLSFGCIYIIRFGTMRTMDKATRWAEEAARTTTFILWNVWVMLAMPVIWLAWSMIFFVAAILSFVWRYGSSADTTSPEPPSPTVALGPRIAISTLFFLGLLYLAAVIKTLQNYGREMERRPTAVGMQDRMGGDVREGERGRQRVRGTSYARDRDRDRESTRPTRGREGTGRVNEQDEPEPLVLSTVMGQGLKGLEDVATPSSNHSQKDG